MVASGIVIWARKRAHEVKGKIMKIKAFASLISINILTRKTGHVNLIVCQVVRSPLPLPSKSQRSRIK